MNCFFVRPESHEIDTLARRKVPLAFPGGWEHRELTGRDYGIDMIIEIFSKGVPTGDSLSLQIKGTSLRIDESAKVLKFDIPVRTLRYSEMFISPVLLVICPVNHEEIKIYYLWLQEYIRVVLNFENPQWRENKNTVRVSIPMENRLPGDEDKLIFLSRFPKRLFEWCQFAKICEDLKYNINNFYVDDDLVLENIDSPKTFNECIERAKEDLKRIRSNVNEMIRLRNIFGDVEWKSPQTVLKDTLEPALVCMENLLSNYEIDRKHDKMMIAKLGSVSGLLSLFHDYSFYRILWKHDGSHDF